MDDKKKRNKQTKVIISLLLVLFLICSISFSFAWFTSKDDVSKSDTIKFGSIALDVQGTSIVNNQLQVNVKRKQIEYKAGGKIMPGDVLSIDLDVKLTSSSQPAYYVVKIKDTLNLFEAGTYFADGTKNADGRLAVYQTDGIDTWLMGDKTKANVVKYVGKITNADTHSLKIEANVDEEIGNSGQGTLTTVDCEIMAIQQAHLSETQARLMMVDVVETGYSQVEYVKSTNVSSNSNAINTGVSWQEVGAIDVTMQFTSVPTNNPMIFATYTSDTQRKAPFIYGGVDGIAFSNISGTVTNDLTKAELTNNGQRSFRISGINSQNTGIICFGSWQDAAWTANFECSSLIMYNKSGKVIRNFIPSVRVSDGVVGFYDAVGKQFFTNLGSDKFTAGDYVMPSDYTRVSYLQSTGKEYIDTGVATSTNINFDLSLQLLDANIDQKIFGSYGNNGGLWLGTLSGQWGYGATRILDETATTEKTQVKLKNGTWYFNEAQGNHQGTAVGGVSGTITLFAARHTSGIMTASKGIKVFELKIYNGETLVRNFVPCKKISDGTLGMFDYVTQQFYTNQGTGAFVCA